MAPPSGGPFSSPQTPPRRSGPPTAGRGVAFRAQSHPLPEFVEARLHGFEYVVDVVGSPPGEDQRVCFDCVRHGCHRSSLQSKVGETRDVSIWAAMEAVDRAAARSECSATAANSERLGVPHRRRS